MIHNIYNFQCRELYTNDFNLDRIVNVTVDGVDPYEFNRILSNLSDNSVLVIPEDFDFSNGPITINANNVTVDGQGKIYENAVGGFLRINGDNVTVKDITFVNGTSDYGAAIYWAGNNGIIENSTFINNTAATRGGGVYAKGKNLTVVDSKFYNNSAYSGGGVYYDGNIKDFEDNSLKVLDCDFTGNKASQDGAGIYVARTVKGSIINNATFKDNSAKYGGAVYTSYDLNGYININDTSFVNNSATGGSAAIYVGKNYVVNITNCEFINPTSSNVINTLNTISSEFNIEDCNFTGNNASLGTIRINNQGTISNININNNTGIGVSVSATGVDINNVTVTNSTGTAFQIDGNDAVLNGVVVSGNNGTAVVVNGNYVDVANSNFANNTGDGDVGVVINGESVSVDNSTFANNTGTSGTGIVLNGEDTNVSGDNTFANNTAQYGASDINVLPGSGLSEDEYKDLMDQYPDADVGKAPVFRYCC